MIDWNIYSLNASLYYKQTFQLHTIVIALQSRKFKLCDHKIKIQLIDIRLFNVTSGRASEVIIHGSSACISLNICTQSSSKSQYIFKVSVKKSQICSTSIRNLCISPIFLRFTTLKQARKTIEIGVR